MSCDICTETFTKVPSRKQAKCPYCPIKACVKCTQTYLIGTHEDPHCMGCRKGWTREVLDSFCLITWLDKDYKHHRQTVLVDRERSRLPAAQIMAENMKEAEKRMPHLEAIKKELEEAHRQVALITNMLIDEQTRIAALKRGESIDEGTTSTEKAVTEKRAFVMPCPATGCRGFLSTAYKCGICENYTCPDCREVKGAHKDTAHTCDPNTVASVQALKKECKNCPECGANIFRIHGCSQMFCTNCHTAFDWGTGKKVTHGAIHNPHYYDYVRQLNGGVMPRAAGDIPCGDGLPGVWQFDRIMRGIPASYNDLKNSLYSALRTINHIRHVEIPNQTNHAEDTDNMQYNVQYLRGLITEKRWKQVLQTREKRRMRRDEIRLRMEAICGAASDVFAYYMDAINKIPNNLPKGTDLLKNEKVVSSEIVKQFENLNIQLGKLRTMFNKELEVVSYRYRCMTPYINVDFTLGKQRADRTGKKSVSTGSDDEEE